MSAQVFDLARYQSKKRVQALEEKLQKHAHEIINIALLSEPLEEPPKESA